MTAEAGETTRAAAMTDPNGPPSPPPRATARAEAETADRVGTADRLRAGVRERIAGLLAGVPAPPADVYVGWVAAQEAATCPARYRDRGEHGWSFPGWSPVIAAGACGRAALAHHIWTSDLAGAPGRPPPLPDPLEAIRTWMHALRSPPRPGAPALKPSSVGDWVCEAWEAGDGATLAALAATAGRWLAGFVRVLGWPLPPQLTLLGAPGPAAAPAPSWTAHKEPTVRVAGAADARLGRVTGTGDFALVVHRVTTGDDGGIRDRAAFEAAAGALAIGVAPARVLVTAGDTGERVTAPVDDDLLAHGADRIVGVVAQHVIAVERGFDHADAMPSPACRHCDRLADCPPGQAWTSTAGRWRGGLPVV